MPINTFVENAWYVAGRAQDFPVNEPKGPRLCNRPVLLWRTGEGKLTAFDDRRVHKRMELRCAPPGKLGVASEERGYVIHHSHTPIDGTNHTWRLWVSTRSKKLTESIAANFPQVMEEDRWALELQQRNFEYPEDGY